MSPDANRLAATNTFSIIIPTFNRAGLLRSALESVQALKIPKGWSGEVLVIDNNSTDETPIVAKESADNGPMPVRYVKETTQGLNHGRNRGLREAHFEHLIYLDDDMLIDPGWLLSYAEAQAKLAPDAVVGPVEPMFEEDPPEWMTVRMIESVTSAYSRKGNELIVLPHEKAHELPGCNFAVLRRVALQLGGFHPSLDRCGSEMLAGGDWEFGERLARSDRKVAYAPGCGIRHLISRHKISREGLRARWEGGGATRRTTMLLRGEQLPFGRRLRFLLRMLRYFGRVARFRLLGDPKEAFRWELETLSLRGLLFGGPRALVGVDKVKNNESRL